MRIALGFRAHSGWAAVVAVSGSVEAPRILERRRILIADAEMPGSKQPYHAAGLLPPADAEVLVNAAVESSRGLALEAISALRKRYSEVAACAVLTGPPRTLPPLEKILASHALIHTSEGILFREVLLWAARESGLPAVRVPEKELDPGALRTMAGLGRLIGPPWTQDQKYAAVAAFTALRSADR